MRNTLSKLPENCPICGSKLEKGYVFNPYASSLAWSKEKKRTAAERIVGENITWFGYNFVASRCPYCMMIFLPYGERAKEIEREEDMKEKEQD
jgi:hypothetical protein